MKTLVLQHFSDYWEESLKTHGTNFETELQKVIDYIRNEKIDRIIIPLYEEDGLTDCHNMLRHVCNEEGIMLVDYHYPYNWSKESDPEGEIYSKEKEGITWCQGTRDRHGEHDVIEIEDWMHQLKTSNDEVIVAGAFEGECVLDLTTAFEAIYLEYEKEDSLVVGAYVDYEFRGNTPEKLREEITDKLAEIEREVQLEIIKMEEKFDEVISDLEELHEYSPNFVMNIEDQINELYEDNREDLEIMDIYHEPNIGAIDCIIEQTYEPDTESDQFQSIPDEYLNHLLEYEIKKLENSYEDFSDFESIKEFSLHSVQESNQYYCDLKKIYKDLLSSNDFEASDIEDIGIDNFTNNVITDDIWENYILKEEGLDTSMIAFMAEKELEKTISGTYYHGGCWKFEKGKDIEDLAFVDLDMDYSALGAVYISNCEKTAEEFSPTNMDSDMGGIEVVMQYENIEINKLYNITNKSSIKIDGMEYSVADDREEYFKQLATKYNGTYIDANYMSGGEDIALLDESLVNNIPSKIKLKINNEWTNYLEPDDAVELFEKKYKENFKAKKKNKIKRT